jgi:L-aminopeptidase/D-esterase-like protein
MKETTHQTMTAVPGIEVGHATDLEGLTGCTVVLCREGAVGGVDQRGGAPGTRETDLLRPMHMVDRVHAILLAGGSAFGLAAADGVMRYLEEQGVGVDTGAAKVPIVPAAILFDLGLGDPGARPDSAMGYAACLAASGDVVGEGTIGAGTGAAVGGILGPGRAMKSGLGSAAMSLGEELMVGAVMAVNAFGDVIDPDGSQILAGARSPETDEPIDTLAVMRDRATGDIFGSGSRTVIGVVATNATLTKEEVNKVAQMAQDGIARTVRPAHTMVDGDTLFALATGGVEGDVNVVGAYAAEVVAEAVVRAVRQAKGAGGLPAWSQLRAGVE